MEVPTDFMQRSSKILRTWLYRLENQLLSRGTILSNLPSTLQNHRISNELECITWCNDTLACFLVFLAEDVTLLRSLYTM